MIDRTPNDDRSDALNPNCPRYEGPSDDDDYSEDDEYE